MKKLLSLSLVFGLLLSFSLPVFAAENPMDPESGNVTVILDDFEYEDGDYATVSGVNTDHLTDGVGYNIEGERLAVTVDSVDKTIEIPIKGSTRGGDDGDWSDALYFGFYVHNTFEGQLLRLLPDIVNDQGAVVNAPGGSTILRIDAATGSVTEVVTRASDGLFSAPVGFEGYFLFPAELFDLENNIVRNVRVYTWHSAAVERTFYLDEFLIITEEVAPEPTPTPEPQPAPQSPLAGYTLELLDGFNYEDGDYATVSGANTEYLTFVGVDYNIVDKKLALTVSGANDRTIEIPIKGTTRMGDDGDWSGADYYGFYVENTFEGNLLRLIPRLVNDAGTEVNAPGQSEYIRINSDTGVKEYLTTNNAGMFSLPADFKGYILYESNLFNLDSNIIRNLRFYTWHNEAITRTFKFDMFFLLNEQPEETEISLTKDNGDFMVNITGWQEDYKYQIWTWQEVASDAFGSMNQWVLSQPYTLGSEMDPGPEGSISANLGDVFNSPDKFYTVAVKVIDGDGNFVGQFKDTYTSATVGEVVIEKVEVDGVFADERTVVKNIEDETVGIEVFTNITQDVTYEATVNPGNIVLTPEGNSFDWDISALEPGRYTVTIKAQNGGASDERIVRFNLYKVDETIVYGQMDTMTVTGGVDEGVFAIDIDPDIPSGNWVNYTISEPWRAAIHRSSSVDKETAQGGMTDVNISEGEFGIYQVAAYVRRSIGGSADDGMIRRVEYARDGARSLDIEVDGDGYTSGTLTKDEGVQIEITPDANLDLEAHEEMEYSYWRRDARGWVMIRDYSNTPGLTWTPARVGLYTIQVRAKGSDAGSYELIQNIEFNVTGTDPLLTVDEITLSGTDNVDARVPVTITAGVVNPSSEDLLYKYIISNDYIYYVETAYSVDPTYIWTPGKAGEYRVSVLVKNQASFGKYDEVQTFTVDVE